MTDTLLPEVRWAQRKDNIYLKIDVNDRVDQSIELKPESLHFRSNTKDGKVFDVTIEFFAEVEDSNEKAKWKMMPRYVEFVIPKKEEGNWWSRLTKEKKKYHNIKADWNKWKDEDEEDEGFDTGDMSNMMGGMPGMGGGGMPGMGGMGGMPGMGGMGGEGGMGGMDIQKLMAQMGGGAGGAGGMPDFGAMGEGDDGEEEDDDDMPPLEAE